MHFKNFALVAIAMLGLFKIAGVSAGDPYSNPEVCCKHGGKW
jgi:hypothetical protein